MTDMERQELTAAELDLVDGGMHHLAGYVAVPEFLERHNDQSPASIIGVLIGMATARAA
jgi:hypothetical protein